MWPKENLRFRSPSALTENLYISIMKSGEPQIRRWNALHQNCTLLLNKNFTSHTNYLHRKILAVLNFLNETTGKGGKKEKGGRKGVGAQRNNRDKIYNGSVVDGTKFASKLLDWAPRTTYSHSERFTALKSSIDDDERFHYCYASRRLLPLFAQVFFEQHEHYERYWRRLLSNNGIVCFCWFYDLILWFDFILTCFSCRATLVFVYLA